MQLLVLFIIRLYVSFSFQHPLLDSWCFPYCIDSNSGSFFIEAFVNRKQFIDPLWISRDITQFIYTRIQSTFIRPMVEFKEARLQLGLILLLANRSLTMTWRLDLPVHTDKLFACRFMMLSLSSSSSSEEHSLSPCIWSQGDYQLQHPSPANCIAAFYLQIQ